MSRFETSDDHPQKWHQPVRVPVNKTDVFETAKEMVDDLAWPVVGVDEDGLALTCRVKNGLLGGTSIIVVRVTGPDGIPSSETSCSCESSGALLPRDRRNVAEFIRKFWMRVT